MYTATNLPFSLFAAQNSAHSHNIAAHLPAQTLASHELSHHELSINSICGTFSLKSLPAAISLAGKAFPVGMSFQSADNAWRLNVVRQITFDEKGVYLIDNDAGVIPLEFNARLGSYSLPKSFGCSSFATTKYRVNSFQKSCNFAIFPAVCEKSSSLQSHHLI